MAALHPHLPVQSFEQRVRPQSGSGVVVVGATLVVVDGVSVVVVDGSSVVVVDGPSVVVVDAASVVVVVGGSMQTSQKYPSFLVHAASFHSSGEPFLLPIETHSSSTLVPLRKWEGSHFFQLLNGVAGKSIQLGAWPVIQ